MSMDTIINPLRTFKDGNAEIKVLYYDVDDGIYFEGDKDAKDRNSATYHDWVVKSCYRSHLIKTQLIKHLCKNIIFRWT